MDLEKVLEQEPKNKESKAALDRIQELLNRKSNKTDVKLVFIFNLDIALKVLISETRFF